MKIKTNDKAIAGVDQFEIGLLPGVADHLNNMIAKVNKNSTSIESANAAMELAIWVKDHIRFTADRHPNS